MSIAAAALGSRLRANLHEHWYRRIASLLTAIIVWQLAQVFQGYWWEETYDCTSWLLVSVVAVDWLVSWKTVYRLLIQGFMVLVVTAATAGYHYVELDGNSLSAFGSWLSDNVGQLNPYIGISALVWGVTAFYAIWTTKRNRILTFVFISLLILMICDSFTPIFLWDEAAWVILSGLAWLVADHFHRFQREHPNSWSELLEYPLSFFLPMLAILTGIMVLGVITPSIAPLVKDPYTIWVESRGGTVSGSFTDAKSTSTASGTSSSDTSSGYSRNDSELGGGFKFDYSPVMYVSTSHRSYWRGETRSLYSGDGWLQTKEGGFPSELDGFLPKQQLPIKEDRSRAKTVQVEQAVTMIREEVYPVLFAASPIRQINWVNDELNTMLPSELSWDPDDWTLHWRGASYPKTYSVVSELPTLNEPALKQATAGWNESNPLSGEHSEYYELPDSVTPRVKQIASEIVAGAPDDYEKAKRIETFLKERYPYTNEPDISKRQSADFVDSFLFEVKEGYCDYFSTAMAVLGRSAGLPVRWVKGYAPGTLPEDMERMIREGGFNPALVNPTGEGTYTVRNADAHSWVEIYFDGFGWIPFEPTPGFTFPYTVEEATDVTVPAIDILGDEETAVEEEGGSFNPASRIVLWSSIGLLVLLSAVIVIRRRNVSDAWTRIRHRAVNPNERIVAETNRLIRHARRKGLRREEWETVREASERWSAERKYLRQDLKEVADRFERAKYGSTPTGTADVDQFVSLVRSIRDRL
ncbi:transglutaminase TgpA family protein [Paenibacillus kobensis]|uniref:transglutaminase TgpA family protein n=1 Tax=Paenibacillus kobensis TaxID=59841 RepID=UPI0013E3CF11|nr:transglutaminase domain-containing protein [Paenibacillus kobensis]